MFLAISLLASICWTKPAAASDLASTLDRMFNRHEFDAKQFGPARWIENGAAYTTLEPSPDFPQTSDEEDAPQDIVRYETATGQRRILVQASELVSSSGAKPLSIENYAWSDDAKRLLVYTNSKKVWRRNTRGDYWVLDLATRKLLKLGGDAPESSLMFAKFAPAGTSGAFVRANNIYVEDLATQKIRALTTSGSAALINGTSDWVNEEELGIRDGFRWSPDGKSI